MFDGALIAARAAHFAATLLLEGCIIFRFLVAARAVGAASINGHLRWFDLTTAAAWLIALVSGAAWFLLLGAELADSTVLNALSNGTAWALLTQTQFGWTWIARGVGFALLASILPNASRNRATGILAMLLSVALSGSLVWSGHGAATAGQLGSLHLAADILHLIASGIWVGGLLPFAIWLVSRPDAAADTTRRFSSLASLSVLTLLPTGIINGWSILPSLGALTGTLYGQLLLAKICLFLLMLGFASVNRFVLTPRLAGDSSLPAHAGIRARLVIHSGCEIALGAAIVALVAVLGTLTPVEENHRGHHEGAAETHITRR